jgi:hypothetical protein
MMDVLDEAIDDIYILFEAIDGENVTDQHPAGSRIPFAHWKSLPPETQSIWDTIPDKDKTSTSDAERIAAYLHELGIEDVSPETPTDEVLVEDITPDHDVSAARHRSNHASLVNHGANGGVAGEDVRIVFKAMRNVDIDEDWETLPHIIWTGDTDWDPTILGHTLDDDDNWWFNALSDLEARPFTTLFDEFVNYQKRLIVQDADIMTIDELLLCSAVSH